MKAKPSLMMSKKDMVNKNIYNNYQEGQPIDSA